MEVESGEADRMKGDNDAGERLQIGRELLLTLSTVLGIDFTRSLSSFLTDHECNHSPTGNLQGCQHDDYNFTSMGDNTGV